MAPIVFKKWHQEQIDLLTRSTRQLYHFFGAKPTSRLFNTGFDSIILDISSPENDTHTSGRAYFRLGNLCKTGLYANV